MTIRFTYTEWYRFSLFGGILKYKDIHWKLKVSGFPGNPGIKTWSSNAGDVGLIPGWGAKIPHALSNIVTNSIKTF